MMLIETKGPSVQVLKTLIAKHWAVTEYTTHRPLADQERLTLEAAVNSILELARELGYRAMSPACIEIDEVCIDDRSDEDDDLDDLQSHDADFEDLDPENDDWQDDGFEEIDLGEDPADAMERELAAEVEDALADAGM